MAKPSTARIEEPVQESQQPEQQSNFAERVGGGGDRPVSTHKAGHGVEVNVWNNHSQDGDYQSASIRTIYKDKSGEWQCLVACGSVPRFCRAIAASSHTGSIDRPHADDRDVLSLRFGPRQRCEAG